MILFRGRYLRLEKARIIYVSASAPGRKLLKRPTDTPGLDNSANFSQPPAYNPYENPQQFGNVPPTYDNFSPNYENFPQNQPYPSNNYGL